MCIHCVNANVGVTKNGNSYDKTRAGKKIGTAAGLAYAGYRAVKGFRRGGAFQRRIAGMTTLGNFGGMKNSKLLASGSVGLGVALGAGLVVGIGRLIGAGVDKIINSRRAKAADKAAEVE